MHDGTRVTPYTWAETPGQPVGAVQISHAWPSMASATTALRGP